MLQIFFMRDIKHNFSQFLKPIHQNFTNVFSSNIASKWKNTTKNKNKTVRLRIKTTLCVYLETHMLPVAELLSVGREPLERSIWANLNEKRSRPIWDQPDSITVFNSIKRMQGMDLCTSKAPPWMRMFIYVLSDQWEYKTIKL